MPSDARGQALADLKQELSAERARCAALHDALESYKSDNDKLKAEVASLKERASEAKKAQKKEDN
jgi:regulator of replication initiation timing